MSYNHNTESELARARVELNSIIKEIERIADEIQKFKGIGVENCVAALEIKANSLKKALRQLNRVSSEDVITQTAKKILPIK